LALTLACARDTGAAMVAEEWVALVPHAAAQRNGVTALAVRVVGDTGRLTFTYRLDGDLARIRIPAPAAPQVVHGLWEHTCFEAFVAADGQAAYVELNFSPAGEWAAYAFAGYREPSGLASDGQAPTIVVRRTGDRLELEATVALDRLAPGLASAALHVGASAVIEGEDGTRTYWAVHHPPGAPDFHQADSRRLRVEGTQ
jgi:hypothetical protein